MSDFFWITPVLVLVGLWIVWVDWHITRLRRGMEDLQERILALESKELGRMGIQAVSVPLNTHTLREGQSSPQHRETPQFHAWRYWR